MLGATDSGPGLGVLPPRPHGLAPRLERLGRLAYALLEPGARAPAGSTGRRVQLRRAPKQALGAPDVPARSIALCDAQQYLGVLLWGALLELLQQQQRSRVLGVELGGESERAPRPGRVALQHERAAQLELGVGIAGIALDQYLQVAARPTRVVARQLDLGRRQQKLAVRLDHASLPDDLVRDQAPGGAVVAGCGQHAGSLGGRSARAAGRLDDGAAQAHGRGRELALDLSPGAGELAALDPEQRAAARGQLVEQRRQPGHQLLLPHAEEAQQALRRLLTGVADRGEGRPGARRGEQLRASGRVDPQAHLYHAAPQPQVRHHRVGRVPGRCLLDGGGDVAGRGALDAQPDGLDPAGQPQGVARRQGGQLAVRPGLGQQQRGGAAGLGPRGRRGQPAGTRDGARNQQPGTRTPRGSPPHGPFIGFHEAAIERYPPDHAGPVRGRLSS